LLDHFWKVALVVTGGGDGGMMYRCVCNFLVDLSLVMAAVWLWPSCDLEMIA